MGSVTDTQLSILITFGGQVLTGFGIIAHQFFQGQRADRALRDRALALEEATARTAQETHEKLEDLKSLQAENTRVTEVAGTKADAAYKEANDVNLKLLDIKEGNKEKLERIDATTTDTNEVVQTLKPDAKT